MSIIIINPFNKESCGELLDETFLLRNKVFNERLGWDLPIFEGREIDQYDTDSSYYLVCYEKELGVYGGCRFLPSVTDYMLESTFAHVNCGALPKSKDVWESSRFFIDSSAFKEKDPCLAQKATYELMLGMLEFGFYKNMREVITLTDIRIERIFRMAGWPLERLSEVVKIGNTLSVGAILPISETNFMNIQRKSGLQNTMFIER